MTAVADVAAMTPAQRLRYIRELREWIAFVRKEWPQYGRKVPDHMRIAVMSHAERAATGPHHVWEEEEDA